MKALKYHFVQFDGPRLAATKEQWHKEASQGLAFPTEMDRLLDWVETHQEPRDGDATAFGIFEEHEPVAQGIAEVVVQRRTSRSKWVKLLRLHLKPSIDAALQKGEVDMARDVFTASIVGSFNLQMAHDATTLKIYGRTADQLAFLRLLVDPLNKTKSRFKASIEGRFLCLEAV